MVSYILMCRISAINMNVIGDAKVGGCGVRVDPIESGTSEAITQVAVVDYLFC